MSAPPGPVLGIDLGTTNSVIAIADGVAARVIEDPDGNRLIPSCVSFHPDGSVLVGHEARERRLIDAENTVYSIKRLIGRPFTSIEVQRARERFPFAIEPSKTGSVQVRTRKGTYALPEISAMVLRHLRKVAEGALGVECKRAVITVPANFNELQRSATQAAGKVAGLEVLRILHEPTAATLAYGYGKEKPEAVAVYDLGGGTFDITILDLDGDVFEVVSTAGDTFLGGDDIDVAIAERMAEACLKEHGFDAHQDAQAFERMRAAAEWAKCQLSSVIDAELTLEDLFTGASGRPESFTFTMSRDEVEQRMRPLVARSFDVVSDALREAGRRPKEIGSIVLVGGSTRIPLVRKMVEEFFGKAPRADIDPDLVVAQGAAIHAWTLAGRPQPAAKTVGGKIPLRKIPNVPPPKPRPPERAIPRGPAFAPEEGALPPPGSDPFARNSLDAVAVIAPPQAIGVRAESGLLDLDDPTSRGKVSRSTRDPSAASRADARARAGIPAPMDAPFAEPNARPLVGANVDAPFDVPSPRKLRRDATIPFGTDRSAPAATSSHLDAPFDAPLPLPEPMRTQEPRITGMFDVELESMPPDPPVPPPHAVKPPPPPPPRPPPPPVAASAPAVMFIEDDAPALEAMPLPEPPAWELPAWEPPPPPPAQLAPRIAEIPMPSAPAPLLMDVTPLSLGLETAGGFCAPIVPRNAPLPTEKSRVFSTGRDDQEAVEVRICQGEAAKFADNQLLGTLVLDGIRKAARGVVRVEITFLLDASGTFEVRAVDLDTKRTQQTRIHLQGGLDAAEIDAMRARQERELAS